MVNITRVRKDRLIVLGVIIVIIIFIIIYKLPRIYPSTATSEAFKRRLLGYPRLLYDCDTNYTDKNGAVEIPTSTVLSKMDHKQLSCLYYNYISNIQYLCRRRERLGKLEDGGWDVCVDEEYRLRKPCLVFSVGISNDFTFDDAVNSKYGCEVHSYDPSMGQVDHTYAPDMFFHNIGLSSFNGRMGYWHMRTLGMMRSEIDKGKKKRAVDILKMDIERMEWDVIPEIIKSQSYRGVKQLFIEFHSLIYDQGHYIYEPSREYYEKYLNVLRMLFRAGFRIFWTHKNFVCSYDSRHGPQRTSCNEVYLVQTELG